MKERSCTVTVGIPAYNEESNIGHLLESLVRQKRDSFLLSSVIVVSDGSSDRTVEIARGFSDQGVVVIDNSHRSGVAVRQNDLFEKSDTDIVVLMNADAIPRGDDFLENLIEPIRSGEADISAAKVVPIGTSKTLLGKILEVGLEFSTELFRTIRNGENLYTCRGVARAFSRELYKEFRFGGGVGEDTYAYFYALSNDFRYRYADAAEVAIQVPQNFLDHKRQNFRYASSRGNFHELFGPNIDVDSEYRISRGRTIRLLLGYIVKHPIMMPLYLFVAVFMRVLWIFHAKDDRYAANKWEMASTSKHLLE